MRDRIVTTKGRLYIEAVARGIDLEPPALSRMINYLIAFSEDDALLSPTMLLRLERQGFLMSGTVLEEAEEVLMGH